jgi:hypothetical protein
MNELIGWFRTNLLCDFRQSFWVFLTVLLLPTVGTKWLAKKEEKIFVELLLNHLKLVSFTSAMMLREIIPTPKDVPLKNSVLVFDVLKQIFLWIQWTFMICVTYKLSTVRSNIFSEQNLQDLMLENIFNNGSKVVIWLNGPKTWPSNR